MDLTKLQQASEIAIYLLSSLSSLLFALVIYSLMRNGRILQARQWATPFADTFLVFAMLYLLILADYLRPPILQPSPTDLFISILTFLCSAFTNYLFLLSAFLMSAQAMDQKRVFRIKKWLIGRPYVRSPLLWVLCAIALAGVAGTHAAIPDAVVSVIVLLSMGIALYENRVRTDKAMAWVALLSSIAYAIVYVLTVPVVLDFLIGTLFPGEIADNIASVKDPLTSLVLLVLKFGFFFSGYSLMLSVSGPLQGIERLLANVLHKEKEYLESDGIVRSICVELKLSRVRLFIKLPGSKEKQMALYEYPSSNGHQQEPQILPYRKGEIYDHVMASGAAYREHHENSFHWIFPATYKIGVPVFFHDSVIACLEAEVGKRFTEGNRINLERLANLISPAVQTYREMSALNKLSQDLVQLQIGIAKFDLEKDLGQITEKIYYVASPTTVGVSIEIGFWEYHATYPHREPLEELVKERLCTEPEAEDVLSHNGSCRWLSKGLTIPQVNKAGQKTGEQVFGNFVLGVEKRKQRTEHPTIGTNPACRRALSDQVTDTLLDFIRGHLNQLTDTLGVRLSGLKGTTVSSWLEEVDKTAREARLLWAVASADDDDNLFGSEAAVGLVKQLEHPEAKEHWAPKEDGLWLRTLDQSESGAHHVIKKALKNSKATLWLGVARENFGQELDYESPWKYFLGHFCEIADSALFSILINRERTEQMAEVQSITTTLIATAGIKHQLVRDARGLTNLALKLEVAMNGNAHDKQLISAFQSKTDLLNASLNQFAHELARDERRPCSLVETIKHAVHLVDFSLRQNLIMVEMELPPEATIDVPFYAAANALTIVIDNANDAISEGRIKSGLIRIKVEETNDQFICHVADNGPGVPDPPLKTLLKRVSKSGKLNSHGIGLYLSVYLLRLFDGDIFLTHRGPDPNTTFSLQFPKVKCLELDVND